MRRRLAPSIGLGNPEPELLNNKGKINKKFSLEVISLYFEDFGGFDFSVTKDKVVVGIEPSYQYEKLRIICIARDKSESYVRYGKAMGPYGSKILGKLRKYSEYKNNCKFKRLVDKYHSILFKTSK